MNERKKRLVVPSLAAGLYFSQGFPFGVATYALPLYLSVNGVSATQIGLLSTIGLAWTAKLLWAPLVDMYGTYRRWIMGAIAVIALALVWLGVVPPGSQSFWIAASILALASATQDIGIDALTIRITPQNLLGPVNSARASRRSGSPSSRPAEVWLCCRTSWGGAGSSSLRPGSWLR